jgi:hypothetical protein
MTRFGIAVTGLVVSAVWASALAAAPSSSPRSTCVDVQIGDDRTPYFDCLNEELQKNVRRERSTPQPGAPLSATSPSNQIGTYNEAAARQRMGNAFGISPIPQRPPRPVFVSPLLPGAAPR